MKAAPGRRLPLSHCIRGMEILMNKEKLDEFQPVFEPRSIAVVGATAKPKAGNRFLKTIINCGYEGKLYPVNPDYNEILGLKAYPNLASIPEPVDYVIVSIPKPFVLKLMDDCAVKGVKVVHIFAAGFAETGKEEDKKLEEELARKATEGGFRIIGPNCMGIYNAVNKGGAYGIGEVALREVGPIAFVSQSGGHAAALIDDLLARGLGFTQVVSFGNGCDLKATDFLEYFAVDPKTEIIGAYFEGIKNGQYFLEVAGEISRIKPLLIWKGGKTETGALAAASHTGSLAGAHAVWTAAIKQIGAIMVDNLEEMVDTIMTLQYLPYFKGNRVAIIGGIYRGGGGFSVSAADACVSFGLEVPELTDTTQNQIEKLVPPAGAILRNPIDIGARGPEGRLQKIIELVSADPNVDLVIVDPTFLTSGLSSMKNTLTQTVLELSADLVKIRETHEKPIVNIFSKHLDPDMQGEMMRNYSQARIPIYPTMERAAKAIVNASRYWHNREVI